jgi:D-aminopeptidase
VSNSWSIAANTGRKTTNDYRTDAPLMPHQLNRVAQRAGVGIAQVGGHGTARNSSGDIFVAISTANKHSEQLMAVKDGAPNHAHPRLESDPVTVMKNESIDGVFRACSEATEEAILNCLTGGRDGRKGHESYPTGLSGMPVERVRALLQKHLVTV